ncbi:MAG: 3-isopropylmalate dehydratase small subunit [Candidatus Zixiibacteriota bacterium]|nr:MAG: 3-isopropylmalate dehydratase small subunit [candidate division Zixibacteria bacterium]
MIKGKVILLGDNIRANIIYPDKYHSEVESAGAVGHLFEDLDVTVPGKPDDPGIVVAGENFGGGADCGQAVDALLAAGVLCVVARSYGRNFYRKAINEALPAVVADLVDRVHDGDEIEIDLRLGKIALPNGECDFEPFPAFLQKVVDCGGLMQYVKNEISIK